MLYTIPKVTVKKVQNINKQRNKKPRRKSNCVTTRNSQNIKACRNYGNYRGKAIKPRKQVTTWHD